MDTELILSVVICGRNDDYLGDFKYRLASSINFLCKSAHLVNRINDIEVIVVDWNSDTPLSSDIRLIHAAVQAVKFVTVPPQIAKHFNSEKVFNANCALNAGVRRAKGKYIMIMPADILITQTAIRNLLLLLEGEFDLVFDPENTMLNIGRMLIPWQVVASHPSLREWNRYLQLNSRHLVYDNTYYGLSGGYGAILMSQAMWRQSHGFLESYSGWGGTDTEQSLRINSLYPYIDLVSFGIYFYDMQEKPASQKNKIYSSDYAQNIEFPKSLDTDNRNWGLKKYNLEILSASEQQGFDENKVNPKNSQIVLRRSKVIAGLSENVFRKHLMRRWKHFPHGNEWACLFPIAWVCSTLNPGKYLEFGNNDEHSIIVATGIINSLEIYGIGIFDSIKDAEDISWKLYRNGYRGYSRFLTGDKKTALARLKSSFIGNMSFSLILFRVDLFGKHSISQLSGLMDFLESDGAIVITGKNPLLFEQTWQYIEEKYSGNMLIVCKKYNTGILVKNNPVLNGNPRSCKSEEETLSDAWRRPGFSSYLYELFLKLRPGLNTLYTRVKNGLGFPF